MQLKPINIRRLNGQAARTFKVRSWMPLAQPPTTPGSLPTPPKVVGGERQIIPENPAVRRI